MSKTIFKFHALEVNVENQDLIIPSVYVLKFPKKLYEYLSEVKLKEGYKKNLPISALSKTIRSKFSDIITTDDRINAGNLDNAWIYSRNEIKLEILKLVIKELLEDRLNYKNKKEFIGIPYEIMNEMHWAVEDVTVTFNVNEVGTSNPVPSSISYNFLMSYLTHKLSGKLNVVSTGIREDQNSPSLFNFYHVSSSGKGSEMISWPFKEYKGQYWTYKITFTLQTIPFSSKPYIDISISALRFCSSKIITRKNKSVTTYIKLPEDKIKGEERVVFIQSKLRCFTKENTECRENKEKYWKWESGLLESMKTFLCENDIPDPCYLANNPKDFISNESCTIVSIPIGTHIVTNTSIGSGVSYYDEYAIISKVRDIILSTEDPFFKLISDFKVYNDFYKDNRVESSNCIDFRFKNLPEKMEVYYFNNEWLNMYKESLKEVFIESFDLECNENEFILKSKNSDLCKTLRLEPISLEEWESNEPNFFEIPKNKEAYEGFIKRIRARIRKSPDIICAAFELQYEIQKGNHVESAFKGLIDPKDIIRRIMAEKNRLTQFITPYDFQFAKNDVKLLKREKNKFNSGVKDLLRQLGVINKDISCFKINNDKPILHIGLWFYNKLNKRNFPILVAILNNEPYITYYKEEDHNIRWFKYTQGQTELAVSPGDVVEKNRKYNNVNLQGFIIRAIEDIKSRTGIEDVILYTVAQNCRRFLPWFTNNNFGSPDASLTISNSSNIWDENEDKYREIIKGQTFKDYVIVRLRNKLNNETPCWNLVKNDCDKMIDVPHSLFYGLFKINTKTFYSIQQKQGTYRPSRVHKKSTKADSPKDEYKRPGVLEICIPFTKGEIDEYDIARMTHFLRAKTSIQFNKEATEFPLPVHLAKSACEYADSYFNKPKFKNDNSIYYSEDDYESIDVNEELEMFDQEVEE